MLLQALVILAVVLHDARGQTFEAESDYCRLSRAHTMCRYKGPSPACKRIIDSGVSTSDRLNIVELHNLYRSKIARGREGLGEPGPMPRSSNMRQLVWNNELATIAQRWAEQCIFAHDRRREVDRFNVGQNIYISFSNSRRGSVDWRKAIDSWYNEVAKFSNRAIERSMFRMETGRFTQMIWAATSQIGCGSVTYDDGTIVNRLIVCNYGTAGNVNGQSVYQRGRPCSNCPEGTSCSTTLRGLCAATVSPAIRVAQSDPGFKDLDDWDVNEDSEDESSEVPLRVKQEFAGNPDVIPEGSHPNPDEIDSSKEPQMIVRPLGFFA